MYTVKKGDTLSEIGQRLKIDWHMIAELNDLHAPYTIYPKQKLKLPSDVKPKSKEVKKEMNISSNGIALIKRFEGCRLTAYKTVPSEVYYTIGWGHYGADVRAGEVITQSQADSMLVKDLGRYVDGVNSVLKIPVTQNQFDAMVSLCYNIGVGGFQKSTVIQAVNRGQFNAAANDFLTYNHAGGKVLAGLTNRRQAEKDLFLSSHEGGVPVGGGSSSVISKIAKSPLTWVGTFALLLFSK